MCKFQEKKYCVFGILFILYLYDYMPHSRGKGPISIWSQENT